MSERKKSKKKTPLCKFNPAPWLFGKRTRRFASPVVTLRVRVCDSNFVMLSVCRLVQSIGQGDCWWRTKWIKGFGISYHAPRSMIEAKKKKTYDRNNKVYDCGQIIQTWTRQLFLMWLLTRFLYYFIVFFLGISFHRSRLSRVTSVVIFGIHLCQVWSQRVAFDDLKFVIGTHDSKWSVQNGEFLVLL